MRHVLQRLIQSKAWQFNMDILFLLIPLSVILVLIILGGLWWAINSGQFEDIEDEGERILHED